ncbi:hypothetical protein Asppvi_010703 [Aspergillus pseudoviridinutans]|uniref:Cora-domain-containing protein n=1 Tax=Aspergillus pseudoviridinutans TaxID=1517512 RepID=A0A9P3BQ61_9EURO|nr:uncharacterized protein Asppvi_010703 [Aspergillus pseudoviridinutans]GIJ91731.1 hypothetical protein Asppvi_010703 [Aspergillus pseudoviridinutans]
MGELKRVSRSQLAQTSPRKRAAQASLQRLPKSWILTFIQQDLNTTSYKELAVIRKQKCLSAQIVILQTKLKQLNRVDGFHWSLAFTGSIVPHHLMPSMLLTTCTSKAGMRFVSRERQIIKSRCKPNSAFRLTSPISTFRQKSDGTVERRRLVRGHILDYIRPGVPAHIKAENFDYFPIVSLVPFDNRVPLAIDLPWVWEYEKGRMQREEVTIDDTRALENLQQRIRSLKEFDTELRQNGGDFFIMDDRAMLEEEGHRQDIYRGPNDYTHESYLSYDRRPDPDVSGAGAFLAPWQRLIFCKGLSTAANPDSPLFQNGQFVALPYIALDDVNPLPKYLRPLARDLTRDAITEAVKLHLNCSRRVVGQLNNPYMDASSCFHISFYEMINFCEKESWKIGHMYTKLDALPGRKAPLFRRSAFTTLVVIEDRYTDAELSRRPTYTPRFGTMLVLCPSGSFVRPLKYYVGQGEHAVNWEEVLSCRSIQICELAVIREVYSLLTRRWLQLKEYLAELLQEDFMEPDIYTKLIFDDDRLSRSKMYFWMLACLQEFNVSITDNVNHWELYRQARVDNFTKSDAVDPKPMIYEVDSFCGVLKEIKVQMDELAAAVRARRDGLFNASALGESMNSTRLGQNVKLLTYVSIFYLPLAFCAALWAIPNIDQKGTKTAFSITAVVTGLVNYLLVANLENVVYSLQSIYNSWRRKLVQQMKDDPAIHWKVHGQRLEESLPDRRMGPSEWTLWWYQIIKPFRRHSRKVEDSEELEVSSSFSEIESGSTGDV